MTELSSAQVRTWELFLPHNLKGRGQCRGVYSAPRGERKSNTERDEISSCGSIFFFFTHLEKLVEENKWLFVYLWSTKLLIIDRRDQLIHKRLRAGMEIPMSR